MSEREELTVQDMIDHKIELPATSSDALKKYKDDYLSEFEETEIDKKKKVFYIAKNENKVKPTKSERLVNNGFDDSDGYYKIVVGD